MQLYCGKGISARAIVADLPENVGYGNAMPGTGERFTANQVGSLRRYRGIPQQPGRKHANSPRYCG